MSLGVLSSPLAAWSPGNMSLVDSGSRSCRGAGGWPQAARRARVNSGVSRVGLGLAPEAARCGTGMSGLGGNSSTERDCVPQGGQASSRGTREVPREK